MEFSDNEKDKDLKGFDDFEEIEESVEGINEEYFSDLIEKYLKRSFSNVKSYELKEAWMDANKTQLKLVGNILFESGSNKKTTFIFNPDTSNGHGRLTFLGENVELKSGKNSFKIVGKLVNEEFIPSKLTFNKLNESMGKGIVWVSRNKGINESVDSKTSVGDALKSCIQDPEFKKSFNDSLNQIALGVEWRKVRDQFVEIIRNLNANEDAKNSLIGYLNRMNPYMSQRAAERYLSSMFATYLTGMQTIERQNRIKRQSGKNEELIEEDQILQEYRTKGALGMKNRAEAPAPKVKDLKPSRAEEKTALAYAIHSDPEIEKKFDDVMKTLQTNLASKEWIPNTEENPFLDSSRYNQVSIVDKDKKFWEKGDWQYNLGGRQTRHWTEIRDGIVDFFENDIPKVTITKDGKSTTFNPAKSLIDRLKTIPSSWGEASAYGSMLGTIGADLSGRPESAIVNADNELVHYDVVK